MEGPEKTPILFANKVIRQMVDQFVDERVAVLPEDFIKLRVAFRKLGGSWTRLTAGEIGHVRLMIKLVKKWAKLSGRKEQKDERYA